MFTMVKPCLHRRFSQAIIARSTSCLDKDIKAVSKDADWLKGRLLKGRSKIAPAGFFERRLLPTSKHSSQYGEERRQLVARSTKKIAFVNMA